MTTKKDRFLDPDRIMVSQECPPSPRWSRVHSWKWWETSRILSSDGRAVSKCKTSYCWSPWAWRSSHWYGTHYPRSHTKYRTKRYSCPIPSSCDLGTVSTGSRGSHSKLGSLIHPPRRQRCCFRCLCKFRLPEGGKEGNSRCVSSTTFQGRRNWDRTRISINSQCCDSRWDKDYNTMSLTCTYQAVYDGLS